MVKRLNLKHNKGLVWLEIGIRKVVELKVSNSKAQYQSLHSQTYKYTHNVY